MFTIHEQQDITALPLRVGVIVNSAHPTLMAGGGVCGVIHDVAGPELAIACRAVHATLHPTNVELAPGQGVITSAYNLNADWVAHVVASRPENDPTGALLRAAYQRAIRLAWRIEASSVAFPLLGAGIYGWPYDVALGIAEEELGETELDIHLCLYK